LIKIKKKKISNKWKLPLFKKTVFKYKWPLQGIRVQISGPHKKGLRKKKKNNYHVWLSNDFETGKMPVQSWFYNIDFYQSYVIIKHAKLGVKVWLLFKSSDNFLDP